MGNRARHDLWRIPGERQLAALLRVWAAWLLATTAAPSSGSQESRSTTVAPSMQLPSGSAVSSAGPLLRVRVSVDKQPPEADEQCLFVRPGQSSGDVSARPVAVADPSPVYMPQCATNSTDARRLQPSCYDTCALVGSSGVLSNSSWGTEIDGSQAVIRLNNAPVVGHESDVGRRTTVRIMHDAHLSLGNINKLAATSRSGFIIMWPPRTRPNSTRTGGPPPRFGDVSGFVEEYAQRKRRACAPILRYSPEAYAEVYRLSGLLVGRYPPVVPSTGFLAVITALQLCQKVTVYGLSWGLAPASGHRWHESHAKGEHKPTYYFRKKNHISKAARRVAENEDMYYEHVRAFGVTHHDLGAEKGAFTQLARAHSLEFL